MVSPILCTVFGADIDSVVLLRDEELFTHSDAALEAEGLSSSKLVAWNYAIGYTYSRRFATATARTASLGSRS